MKLMKVHLVRLWLLAVFGLAALVAAPSAHAYAFVTYDAEDGLEFAPATLVTPIVGAAVAAVVAAAVLFVLWIGVKAVKRFVKS